MDNPTCGDLETRADGANSPGTNPDGSVPARAAGSGLPGRLDTTGADRSHESTVLEDGSPRAFDAAFAAEPTVLEDGSPRAFDAASAAEPTVGSSSDALGWTLGAPARPDAAKRAVPAVAGYELLGELGRGGMGVVYKARQVRLNRPCALKMILAGAHARREDCVRFLAEAETAARLQHPNIIQIHSIGDHEGSTFLELEYVEGGSLAQQLDGTPLPPLRAARLIETLTRAMVEAHRLGIVHRDLKPGNVLLTGDGMPKISDFGLAKTLGVDSSLTQSGAIMGTPSYMAPEQAEGKAKKVGPAADIYALGAILYELLTGRPPFRGATVWETLEQVKSAEPVAASRLQPGLPRDLETICLKCLQKEPGKRYDSAVALEADLRRFLAGEPILARRISGTERAWRWCRRNPVVAGLAGGIMLALLLGAAFATHFALRAAQERGLALQKAALAQANALRANQESQRANQEAQRARDAKLLSERRVYLAEMKLAHESWQDGMTELTDRYLKAHEPKQTGEADSRGFEWHYLERLCELDLRTLRGHEHNVMGVAFSPDGRRIASASEDGTVKLWNSATGQEILTLRGHTSNVLDVAFSPDGRRIASVGMDRDLRLWDATTGQQVMTLGGHAAWVLGVAFSPDSRRIATASQDRTIKLWDAETGQNVLNLRGHTGTVWDVVFSPDGRRLATASADYTVKLWDTATGQDVLNLRGHTGPVWGVAFSPDGRQLASASDDRTVKLCDATTGHEIMTWRGHSARVMGVAFSPDGRQIVSTSADQTVRLWDAATGQDVLTLRGHRDLVWGVAFSPDGRRIVSASNDRTVKLWDARTGQDVMTLAELAGSVMGVAFSPDGRRIASACDDCAVRLWDVGTGQDVLTLRGHTAPILGVEFSPDGRRVASACADHTVKLWDATTGQEVQTLRGHTGAVSSAAFAPDGRRIASAGHDQTVKLWDASGAQVIEILTLRGHTARVKDVGFSPDGRRIASASTDGTVKLWDAATGREMLTLRGHAGEVSSVAFSPDCRQIGSAGLDRTVKLWDAVTGQEVLVLRGHSAAVFSLSFSPDGRRIASAGDDKTVRLWDVTTGQEVLTLRGHTNQVTGIAFSPDGRQIASASYDHTVKLWDATPLSPELRVLREARGVVEFFFALPLAATEVLARIRHDPTLSEPVRARALALAEPYGQGLLVHEAELLLTKLTGKAMLRPDILASIRTDLSLSEPVRRQALALAEVVPENRWMLHGASWGVVRQPGADRASYQLALRQAEAACRLVPDDADYRTNLGVAQYRLREYQAAILSLTRADHLRVQAQGGPSSPADLAFLALAQHRVGQVQHARAALALLRESMKKPEWVTDEEALAFLREAETLELDVVFPNDPFAR